MIPSPSCGFSWWNLGLSYIIFGMRIRFVVASNKTTKSTTHKWWPSQIKKKKKKKIPYIINQIINQIHDKGHYNLLTPWGLPAAKAVIAVNLLPPLFPRKHQRSTQSVHSSKAFHPEKPARWNLSHSSWKPSPQTHLKLTETYQPTIDMQLVTQPPVFLVADLTKKRKWIFNMLVVWSFCNAIHLSWGISLALSIE